jgi:integrase
MPTMREKYIRRFNTWLAETKYPGIYKLKKGGYLVRIRATDPFSQKEKEVRRTHSRMTIEQALAWQGQEKERLLLLLGQGQAQKACFDIFAASILQRKIDQGKIKGDSVRKTTDQYTHLINGTTVRDKDTGDVLAKVDASGNVPVERITARLIQTWKSNLGKLIRDGHYRPSTINGWFAQLRELMSIAVTEHDLRKNPMNGVKDFDLSEHRTYSEKAPNSLDPNQTMRFLEKLLELYPQHYAFAYLGFMTGGRISIMITLRRSGPDPDIDWSTGRLLNRRSKGHGPEVRQVVKQKDNFGVPLPQELVDILQWHVETQLDERQVKNKEHLLFPGSKGATYRSLSSLAKPFAKVAQAIGVKFRFTQRGMRRTFNDLSRAAKLEPDIIRSISGHHTDQMREWYSTYRAGERRAGIAAVIDVVAAHRAIGEALGGSDFDDAPSDDAAEGTEPASSSELPLAGGMGGR